jgi:hypothetical protein
MPENDLIFRDKSMQQPANDIDAEKRMHETLRRSERRLAAQKQALELAVSGAAIGVVLSPVAEETRKQVSGDARAALYVVDSDGARLRFGAAAGLSESYASLVPSTDSRSGRRTRRAGRSLLPASGSSSRT